MESASRALPAKIQNTAGGRVRVAVKDARPSPDIATRRRAPYLAVRRAPGIEAAPRVRTIRAVREPVAEKLSPTSDRMAGREGGIANMTTRRLNAVSQTSPSGRAVRGKPPHPKDAPAPASHPGPGSTGPTDEGTLAHGRSAM